MKSKSLAIPIRIVDFSESSQIVRLFTREHGSVDGIAKGAYREKTDFDGPFDLAVLYEVVFVGRREGGLAVLTESAVVDGFRGLRRAWPRYAAACHLIELLRGVSTAWAPDATLFDLAAGTLGRLEGAEGDRVDLEVARFDALALRSLGLLPPLSACVRCGRPWPGGRRSAFVSPAEGGLLCSACRAASVRGAFRVPAAAVRALVALSDFESSLEESVLAWRECRGSAGAVVARLRDHLLERGFPTLKVPRF